MIVWIQLNSQVIALKRLNPMKKTTLSIWRSILFLILIGAANLVFGDERVADLQQKIADISLLQSQLNERKSEAIEIREKLYKQLSDLTTEIKAILAQKKIKEFNNAEKTPRIHHNLQLSAEIYAHIDQFNQKIRFYQIGQDKLDYLYQKADDDLKIINNLTNLKIEALLAQIDAVIIEYLPEAHRILIRLDNSDSLDTKTVWKKINQN